MFEELKKADPNVLKKVLAFVQSIKDTGEENRTSNPILEFAGKIDDEEAEELRQTVASEFSSIEGDW